VAWNVLNMVIVFFLLRRLGKVSASG